LYGLGRKRVKIIISGRELRKEAAGAGTGIAAPKRARDDLGTRLRPGRRGQLSRTLATEQTRSFSSRLMIRTPWVARLSGRNA
jgi:hypothetical protein